jgi:hypothetical protein
MVKKFILSILWVKSQKAKRELALQLTRNPARRTKLSMQSVNKAQSIRYRQRHISLHRAIRNYNQSNNSPDGCNTWHVCDIFLAKVNKSDNFSIRFNDIYHILFFK